MKEWSTLASAVFITNKRTFKITIALFSDLKQHISSLSNKNKGEKTTYMLMYEVTSNIHLMNKFSGSFFHIESQVIDQKIWNCFLMLVLKKCLYF